MNQMDGIQADVFGVGEVAWINLDVEHEILSDPLVREAIFLAVDRENHIALNGEPVAMPDYSVVPHDLIPDGRTEEEAHEAGVTPAPALDRARAQLADDAYA